MSDDTLETECRNALTEHQRGTQNEIHNPTSQNPQLPLYNCTAKTSNWESVADVACLSLDDAYLLTNHTDGDWRNNKQVKNTFTESPRSTSIGDIIYDTKSGRTYQVGIVGFEREYSFFKPE